ncbi:acyl-CoA thioesterase [Ferrimonas balearica]|uniref:acyl-CoA thioesterase n=1 Tax=Ferrimonas balearica TaxID=44012 RepID=UPI001C578E5A|nr:thioesterase family protein [Ferrimonas balearica]MBW3141336.1 acyl-CoA thioesterase [Ferrimonas balearica]MBY6108380.1 acyl-CoA thioesterase [Ferrimonas balearica]
MFTTQFDPRFMETDALGHINNTVIPVWFEEGRTPIFELFVPQLDLSRWNLILASVHVDFLAQTYYGQPVTIETRITRLGGASFDVSQQVVQDGKITARGKAVMVHFDYKANQSAPIPAPIRTALEAHLSPE